MSFGPICPPSLSITPHFSHFLSSTCTNYSCLQDQPAVFFPSHPQLFYYPPQFSPLHLLSLQIIISLILPKSGCLFHLCHSSLYCVTVSTAYPIFLLHNTQFFHMANWRLYRCGGIWRKQASPNGGTVMLNHRPSQPSIFLFCTAPKTSSMA